MKSSHHSPALIVNQNNPKVTKYSVTVALVSDFTGKKHETETVTGLNPSFESSYNVMV